MFRNPLEEQGGEGVVCTACTTSFPKKKRSLRALRAHNERTYTSGTSCAGTRRVPFVGCSSSGSEWEYVPLSNARPRNPNMATHPLPVQTYSVKAFGPFFTWVYHAEDAAVTSLDGFEKMDTQVTMNQLKFLQDLYEPSLLQRVTADMSRPKTNIKEIQDRASAYQKQQWINWHWGAASDSVIHPSRSMLP